MNSFPGIRRFLQAGPMTPGSFCPSEPQHPDHHENDSSAGVHGISPTTASGVGPCSPG